MAEMVEIEGTGVADGNFIKCTLLSGYYQMMCMTSCDMKVYDYNFKSELSIQFGLDPDVTMLG